jgi:hypothetical protein
MNTYVENRKDISAHTASHASSHTAGADLERFIACLGDMDLAGEYPSDPRLDAMVLPDAYRRVVLYDESNGEELASIVNVTGSEQLSAHDVMSSLWMHGDYLDRRWVASRLKRLEEDTVEILVRLDGRASDATSVKA